MTRKDFLKDVQQHVANIAIGTSTLRHLGEGIMQKAREYLGGTLNLTRLKSIEPNQYAGWLEERTIELRKEKEFLILAEKGWGPARKALNIFLCHAYLNRFLAEAYCLDRLGDVMETPLDSRAAKRLKLEAKRLKLETKGRLSQWLGVTGLQPEKSDVYQKVATEVAADYARKHATPMRRACLDIVLWPNDPE